MAERPGPRGGALNRICMVAGLLALGALGGFAARAAYVPLPFMIGGLGATAGLVIALCATGRAAPSFPQPLRKLFVGIIGALIGAQFTPDLLALAPALWTSLLAIALFVVAAEAIGYFVYRRIGGYDRTTAIFAAMPGGLIEAVAIGEAAGGDVRALTIQHFARIVLVVVAVPVLFLIFEGLSVGSATGQGLHAGRGRLGDVGPIALIAIAGIFGAAPLRLPASHLTGPLALSAALHATGVVSTAPPGWLLGLSQLVVGVGLGTLFGGATLAMLARAFGLGAIAMTAMIALGFGLAAATASVSPMEIEALFISFAPGGVTEMALVALSLGISPMLVTVHHLFRISLTVVLAGFLARRG